MKKIQYLALALCAIAFAVSCDNKFVVDLEPVAEPQTFTFTCVIDNAPDTRLAIDGQGKTSWEPNDQIVVHGDGKSNRITVTLTAEDISADGKSATISVSGITPYDRSEDGITSTIYAAYPADAVSSSNLGYYAVFKESNRPLMMAYNLGDKLIFRNCCSLITFTVTGDYDSYTFTGNNDETVGYGTYESKITYKNGKEVAEYKHWTDGPLTTISGPVTGNGSTKSYIYIPAGADFTGGFTLRLLKGGVEQKKALTGTHVNLAPGDYLNLGNITAGLRDPDYDPDAVRMARLGQTPIICCYFTEHTKEADFPTLEDVRCFTHINAGQARFVNPKTGDGGLTIKDPGPSYISRLAAYKEDYPKLKILLMIGGWGQGADGFSEMAKDDDKRALFCSECVRLCKLYNLDGVDLDWEYPTYAAKTDLGGGEYYYNGADAADRQNFTRLVRDLRTALGPDKLITFAASSSDYDDADYIDYSGVLQWVDYINVMTYSMGSPKPSNPSKQKHNSPLHTSTNFYNSRGGADCIEGYHTKQGIPYDRMNYGIAFYGHGDGDKYPSSVTYPMAVAALETGMVNGKSVSGYNKRWWDEDSKSCYLGDANGVMYASYEDAVSIGHRVAYVKSTGLLGCMIWEYCEDDSDGTLRKALHTAMTGQ